MGPPGEAILTSPDPGQIVQTAPATLRPSGSSLGTKGNTSPAAAVYCRDLMWGGHMRCVVRYVKDVVDTPSIYDVSSPWAKYSFAIPKIPLLDHANNIHRRLG